MATQGYAGDREKLTMLMDVLDLNFLQDPLSQTLFFDVNKEHPAVWLQHIVIKRWLLIWQILLGSKSTTTNEV